MLLPSSASHVSASRVCNRGNEDGRNKLSVWMTQMLNDPEVRRIYQQKDALGREQIVERE